MSNQHLQSKAKVKTFLCRQLEIFSCTLLSQVKDLSVGAQLYEIHKFMILSVPSVIPLFKFYPSLGNLLQYTDL